MSALVTLILALTACSTGGSGSQATATSAAGSSVTAAPGVNVLNIANNAKLGKLLVDGKGLTLYTFKLDTPEVSSCLSTCGATWPPLRAYPNNPEARNAIRAQLLFISHPEGRLFHSQPHLLAGRA